MDAQTVQQVVSSLKEGSLERVDLSGKRITLAEVQDIAEGLSASSTVTVLDLSHNNIGEAGAGAIAAALLLNRSLTAVDLGGNCIGNKGACEIATALEASTSLAAINLRSNGISEIGAQRLAAAVEKCSSLIMLDLALNHALSSETKNQIYAAVDMNSKCIPLMLDLTCAGDLQTVLFLTLGGSEAAWVEVEASTAMFDVLGRAQEQLQANRRYKFVLPGGMQVSELDKLATVEQAFGLS